MIIKNQKDIPQEKMDIKGGEGISIQWLLDKRDTRTFSLRRFKLKGAIPVHAHNHEHEIYILEGRGELMTATSKTMKIGPGDFVYIEENEPHGFQSKDKITGLVFLCIIPNQTGETVLIK